MSNLESRLKKLEALNFPSSDVGFMDLSISTLEGMMAYLEYLPGIDQCRFQRRRNRDRFCPASGI